MVQKIAFVILRHVNNEKEYAHWKTAIQSIKNNFVQNEKFSYSITVIDDCSRYQPCDTLEEVTLIQNKIHPGLAEMLPFIYFSTGEIEGDAMVFLHDTMYFTAPLQFLGIVEDVKPIYTFKMSICRVSLSNGLSLITPDCKKMIKNDYPLAGFFGTSVYITKKGVMALKPFIDHYITNAKQFCQRKYRIGLERALPIECKFRGLTIGKSFCGDILYEYPGGYPCTKPPAPGMVGKLCLGRSQ